MRFYLIAVVRVTLLATLFLSASLTGCSNSYHGKSCWNSGGVPHFVRTGNTVTFACTYGVDDRESRLERSRTNLTPRKGTRAE